MDNKCFEESNDIKSINENIKKCSISEVTKGSDISNSKNNSNKESGNSNFELCSKNLKSDINGTSDSNKVLDECNKSVINEQKDKKKLEINSNCVVPNDQTSASCSGVKKKCVPLTNINGQVSNGAKKKIKMNGGLISPGSEYYKIWSPKNPCKIMKFVYDNENIVNLTKAEETAPPLPPRLIHRPLERSHAIPPPQVFRHQKPKKMTKPEDTFNFELIDTDEHFSNPNVENTALNSAKNVIDFEPGEFYIRKNNDMPHLNPLNPFLQNADPAAPLATPETDGSICESTSTHHSHKLPPNKRLLESSIDSPMKSKPLLTKTIGPDNYITAFKREVEQMDPAKLCDSPKHEIGNLFNSIESQNLTPNHLKSQERAQNTFLENITNQSEFEDENKNQIEIKQISTIKSHKPLTRQTSNTICKTSNSSNNIANDAICSNDLTLKIPPKEPINTDVNTFNIPLNIPNLDQPSCSTHVPTNFAVTCESDSVNGPSSSSQFPAHATIAKLSSNGQKLAATPNEGTPKHNLLTRCEFGNKPNFEGSPIMRPHPRALARVAGHIPQCPPTPTHHARRNRPVPPPEVMRPPCLKANQPELMASPEIKHADIRPLDTTFNELKPITDLRIPECMTELRTSEIRSPNLDFVPLGDFVLDRRAPDVRSNELANISVDMRVRESRSNNLSRNDSNESSSNPIPLPLRHIASTRLPSIPERINRHLPLSSDGTNGQHCVNIADCDEPLPPCTFIKC